MEEIGISRREAGQLGGNFKRDGFGASCLDNIVFIFHEKNLTCANYCKSVIPLPLQGRGGSTLLKKVD